MAVLEGCSVRTMLLLCFLMMYMFSYSGSSAVAATSSKCEQFVCGMVWMLSQQQYCQPSGQALTVLEECSISIMLLLCFLVICTFSYCWQFKSGGHWQY